MLPCKVCQGNKTVHHPSFTALDGTVYPDRNYSCNACNGAGEFSPIDEAAILKRITAGQGKNKGKLRAAMSSPSYKEGCDEARAYYVWRIARFHGGKDMTMPMVAGLTSRGDPYKDELEKLAEKVAKIFFGTDLAATLTWGRALGLI